MASEHQHHVERGLRDQIERYRTAFIAVVTMIIVALLVGGYILSQERLSLPAWVPVIGTETFKLRADFSTGQALTPGQGQAVTIAGAKVGEIASVDLHEGHALVTMSLTPKYARYIYRNATLLLRPKTQLKDMTVEIEPGTPKAGRVPANFDVPLAQTAPDVSFDEFLAGLDAETRSALQGLLAGAAQGLKGNAANLSAAFKRFDPLARDLRQITAQLQLREKNISHSIHNFQLILSALGGKDRELAQLIDASNANFQTFAEQDANFQKTLRLLPGALAKTRKGLSKLSTAAREAGPTLRALEPFAKAVAPAEEASRPLFAHTAPIFKNQIRPLAREILSPVNQLQPSLKQLGEAFPGLASSFAVFNEFFNELAYNPGAGKGGFMFFLNWANHDLNSIVSSADAHGPVGRTIAYLNCKVLPILTGAAEINPTVNLLVALFNPPSGEECIRQGLIPGAKASATTASSGGR